MSSDSYCKQHCEKLKLAHYISSNLNPLLTSALDVLCKSKPENPLEFIAQYLLLNNPEKYDRKLTEEEVRQLELEEQDRLMIQHLTHERSFQESKQSLKNILKKNREHLDKSDNEVTQNMLALSQSLSLGHAKSKEFMNLQQVIQQFSDENDDESELIDDEQLTKSKKYQYQRYQSGTVRIVQKQAEVEAKVKARLKGSEIANIVSPEELMILARATEFLEFANNEWVLKPGDTFDSLYLIETGSFDSYLNSQLLRSFHQYDFLAPIELGGSLFGVKCKGKGGVFIVDKQTYECVVKEKLQAWRERVQKVIGMKGIAGDAMREVEVKEGEVMVTEGEDNKTVYFIEEGEFEVLKNNQRIRTLKAMDYFGEVAAIKKVPRTATVKAISDGKIFAIEGELFIQLVYQAQESKFSEAMDNYQ